MGTTDKKNRITRDDKETTGSVDNGSGNGSTDASASLAARRAKLRGALGGAKTGGPMPDPFSSGPAPYPTDEYGNPSDPYGTQQTQYPNDPYANQQNQYPQSDPFGTQTDPYASQEETPYPQPDIDEALDAYMQQAQQNEFPTQQPTEEYGQEQEVNVYGVPIDEAPADILPPSTPEPRVTRSRRTSNTASTAIPTSASSSFEAVPSMPSVTKSTSVQPLPPVSDKTVELVNSIDQSLNICATNLAALQNLAGEQTEVLKGLSQTLQNQTLLEIGLNLNSLTESLTAALEPMKSIGELVPALDSLVSALEGKEQDQSEKLSPDQLVTSLADQLSAGLIDPWTFKCAYMAVYPADHPADLLHRLVELLGTQRLSGDLFRAAYEAVQAAEPPPGRTVYAPPSGEARAGIVDENIKAQLDNLERANRELQKRQDERERELNEVLAQKDQELQSAQEQLNHRFEELNGRYADAADMIAAREDEFRAALESKDMDIIEKDAELNMLRAQMEELREQTESMVKD
ncbi:MAG: hypothetical protein K2X81_00440, partial [Candidatus Obscuribacterales bacterium]|nr:hypothetical protein [Candidatus Obscuribacterales bacterium]